LVSDVLPYGTHIASKIPNDWPQGKSELCFLETLQLDTRVNPGCYIMNTVLLLRGEAKFLIIVPYVFKIKSPLSAQKFNLI